MRHFYLLAAAFLTVSVSVAQAGPAAPMSTGDGSTILLVQNTEKKKSEPVKEKVKRVWRNLTGTKFDVGCPTLAFALNRTTCTATGKKADAMAKCQQQHPLCQIAEKK